MDASRDNDMNEVTEFCFHGSYERAVDAKVRFNLPFRFRRGGGAAEDERYVVMRGQEGNLALFPREEWVNAFNRIKRQKASRDWRAQLRRLSSDSCEMALDAQGRVTVPQEFLREAGIDKRVTAVGMGHYMELWSPDGFAAQKDQAPGLDQDFMDEFLF